MHLIGVFGFPPKISNFLPNSEELSNFFKYSTMIFVGFDLCHFCDALSPSAFFPSSDWGRGMLVVFLPSFCHSPTQPQLELE